MIKIWGKLLELNMENKLNILEEVSLERIRQDSKWGEQSYESISFKVKAGLYSEKHAKELCDNADKDGTLTWSHIAFEEFAEVIDAKTETLRREEIIQLCAVLVAWVENIDRNKEKYGN